jgi:hypothetical protein
MLEELTEHEEGDRIGAGKDKLEEELTEHEEGDRIAAGKEDKIEEEIAKIEDEDNWDDEENKGKAA